MNTHNNPLAPRGNTPVIRALFLTANMAERSLLSLIYHELDEFRLMAAFFDYEGERYQAALNDYLTALTGRYDTLTRSGDELEQAAAQAADKEETPDDP